MSHNERYGITDIQAGTVVNRHYAHDFNGVIKSIKQNNTIPSMPNYTYVTNTDLISKVTEGITEYDYTYDANL